MSEKVSVEHLKRSAYVYIRQSSSQQVRFHLEGQKRQYGLAERARQLGFYEVVVIDEDLGRSGSGVQERPGFGRLLAAVCQGLAGAVVALEASRLARNNRDWHHLVDLCALTATVLIDDDGIYDPQLLNDRLLLGLKGTMSEYELGLMRQRARQAYLQKVHRGCALWQVAVGFVRTEDGQIDKNPDRQVQQVIEAVFEKFRQLGSARQTMIWFREEQIRLPQTRPGSEGREVVWQFGNVEPSAPDSQKSLLRWSLRLRSDGHENERGGGPHTQEPKPALQIPRAMGRVDSRSSLRLHRLGGVSEEPQAYGAELSPARGRGKRSGEERSGVVIGFVALWALWAKVAGDLQWQSRPSGAL